MATHDMMVGPWGGEVGSILWIYKPNGRITEIRIKSGDIVDSLAFTHTDENGTRYHTDTFGGSGGSLNTITFDDDEDITGFSGTFGYYYGAYVIKSLSFQTNKTTYGPYGTTDGTSFSVPSVTNGKIAGFHGSYGNFLMKSFGVILHPY